MSIPRHMHKDLPEDDKGRHRRVDRPQERPPFGEGSILRDYPPMPAPGHLEALERTSLDE